MTVVVAKPSGNKNKNTFSLSDSGFSHLVAIYSIQTLALAAALAFAISTPLTEGGRKTQW